MMIRLNNKGQSLVMFICLLPILLLIVLAIVDVSGMVIEKNKLNNINYIAISYYSSHKEDDDVTEIIIMLFNNGLIKDRFLERSLTTNGNPVHVLDDSLTRMGEEFINYIENVKSN